MAMSKKDYEAFAKMFKEHMNWSDHSYLTGVLDCINGAATIFANDNPRFDRDKFFKACGVSNAYRT